MYLSFPRAKTILLYRRTIIYPEMGNADAPVWPARHPAFCFIRVNCRRIGFSNYLCKSIFAKEAKERAGHLYDTRHEKRAYFPHFCQ